MRVYFISFSPTALPPCLKIVRAGNIFPFHSAALKFLHHWSPLTIPMRNYKLNTLREFFPLLTSCGQILVAVTSLQRHFTQHETGLSVLYPQNINGYASQEPFLKDRKMNPKKPSIQEPKTQDGTVFRSSSSACQGVGFVGHVHVCDF